MQLHRRPSSLSLRVKLVLSYLMVALGAIFILAAVVLFAIQSYFANVQLDNLYSQTQFDTTQAIHYRLCCIKLSLRVKTSDTLL